MNELASCLAAQMTLRTLARLASCLAAAVRKAAEVDDCHPIDPSETLLAPTTTSGNSRGLQKSFTVVDSGMHAAAEPAILRSQH